MKLNKLGLAAVAALFPVFAQAAQVDCVMILGGDMEEGRVSAVLGPQSQQPLIDAAPLKTAPHLRIQAYASQHKLEAVRLIDTRTGAVTGIFGQQLVSQDVSGYYVVLGTTNQPVQVSGLCYFKP